MISYGIKRYGDAKQYRDAKRDIAAWKNALRPTPFRLVENPNY